jgi:hypothetical protein
MGQVTKMFVEHIQRWLDDEIKKDKQLAAKVQQSGKTADQACNYVLSEVRKSGRCGFDDPEVYGMVRHFFDEDEIKDPGRLDDIERIVIPEHIELSESEKAEAKAKALAAYEAEQLANLKAEAEAREKKNRERLEALKAKRQAEGAYVNDLFGGL